MTKTYKIHAKYWNAGLSRQKQETVENIVPSGTDHDAIRIAVAWARVHEFKPHKDHSALSYLSVCRVALAPANEETDTEETMHEEAPFFEWYDHYLLDIRTFADALVQAAEHAAARSEAVWE